MLFETRTVSSIHELLEPGKITAVLVNKENFNNALASALNVSDADVPPVVEGDQVIVANGKSIRVINWVDEDTVPNNIRSEAFTEYMDELQRRMKFITEIQESVSESGEPCLVFLSYRIKASDKSVVFQPTKVLFLSSHAMMVSDTGNVTIMRQPISERTGSIADFQI